MCRNLATEWYSSGAEGGKSPPRPGETGARGRYFGRSALDGAGGQALDEIALEEYEDDGHGDSRHNRGRHHIPPVGGGLPQEGHHQARGQGPAGAVRHQGHGVEQVVPAPHEPVNGDGDHARYGQGKDDLQHDPQVARPIQLGALHQGVGNLVKVALQGPGAHGQGEDHIADNQGPVAAQKSRLVHHGVDGQQQNGLGESLAHHKHSHDELPAPVAEFGEAVARQGGHQGGHEAGAEGNPEAVFQIGHNLRVRDDVKDVVQGQGTGEEIAGEGQVRGLQGGVDHPQQGQKHKSADEDDAQPEENPERGGSLKHGQSLLSPRPGSASGICS